MTTALDAALLEAHAHGDTAALVSLYHRAACEAATEDALGFYLTQAYVFALDCGDVRTDRLRRELVARGRDTDDQIERAHSIAVSCGD